MRQEGGIGKRSWIAGAAAIALTLVSGGCTDGGQGNGVAGDTDAVAGGVEGAPQYLPKIPVLIRHGEGTPDTRLSIELAAEPHQQEKGLMHRTDLSQGEGMLFPMLPPRMPSFWMKDTPTSLDLVFIRPDGGVAKIVARAKPNDPTPLFADVPVAAVLELRGGDAASLGLDEGDRVSWGACTQGGQKLAIAVDNFCP
ncbi:MAG: DUF192 domain-containing protein [Sphingomonadales bacterium]|nr:MAG: DUF192 domain-containing protein [Sphingomonadales bacterium]TNF05544.1 MAG: DUF192 domain-containing protein [Sphingomonadales bacterium]